MEPLWDCQTAPISPLRVGLGAGTLYGVGVGAYDVTTGEGNPIVVSGLFNDGYNSSIIVLLDTFYGAAAGAVVATSVMLIAGQPLIDGLQYGSSAGAIAGFGVGIVDAFVLSDREMDISSTAQIQPKYNADGFVSIRLNDNTSVGFVSPSAITRVNFSTSKLRASVSVDPTVNFLNIKVNL